MPRQASCLACLAELAGAPQASKVFARRSASFASARVTHLHARKCEGSTRCTCCGGGSCSRPRRPRMRRQLVVGQPRRRQHGGRRRRRGNDHHRRRQPPLRRGAPATRDRSPSTLPGSGCCSAGPSHCVPTSSLPASLDSAFVTCGDAGRLEPAASPTPSSRRAASTSPRRARRSSSRGRCRASASASASPSSRATRR